MLEAECLEGALRKDGDFGETTERYGLVNLELEEVKESMVN